MENLLTQENLMFMLRGAGMVANISDIRSFLWDDFRNIGSCFKVI